MSWLKAIFGGNNSDVVSAVGDTLDELFTSDDERNAAKIVMQKLRMEPAKLQAKINLVEAGHRSVFVAGWRPFIGWVCGVALAYHFIILPFLTFIILANGIDLPPLPEFDMATLSTVLTGMLGLGALRTVEKAAGKSK